MSGNTGSSDITIDNMNALERGLKRSFDFLVALLGLFVLSPVFLVISLILKREGVSSVFFSQERIGKGGKPFRIYKFRTMTDERAEEGPTLARDDDERITPHGRYLRKHHLDELPQLWNVVRGDMSFVGYRPERKFFVDQIMQHNPDYALLYCSRPGITSDSAIYNGYTYTMNLMLCRLDFDLDYLRRRTLLLDLKILVKTVLVLLKEEN